MKPIGSDKQPDCVVTPYIGLFRFLFDKGRPWQAFSEADFGEKDHVLATDNRTDVVGGIPEKVPYADSNYGPYYSDYCYIRKHMDAFEYDRFLRLYSDVYSFLQEHNLYRFFTFDKSYPWYFPMDSQDVRHSDHRYHYKNEFENCVVGTYDEIEAWIDNQTSLDYPDSSPRLYPVRQSYIAENNLSEHRLYYRPADSLFCRSVEHLKTNPLEVKYIHCIALFLDNPLLGAQSFVNRILDTSYFIRSFLEEYDADC